MLNLPQHAYASCWSFQRGNRLEARGRLPIIPCSRKKKSPSQKASAFLGSLWPPLHALVACSKRSQRNSTTWNRPVRRISQFECICNREPPGKQKASARCNLPTLAKRRGVDPAAFGRHGKNKLRLVGKWHKGLPGSQRNNQTGFFWQFLVMDLTQQHPTPHLGPLALYTN